MVTKVTTECWRTIDTARERSMTRLRAETGDIPGWVLVTLMTAGLPVSMQWGYCGRPLGQTRVRKPN